MISAACRAYRSSRRRSCTPGLCTERKWVVSVPNGARSRLMIGVDCMARTPAERARGRKGVKSLVLCDICNHDPLARSQRPPTWRVTSRRYLTEGADKLLLETPMRFDLQHAPGRIQDADDAHIGTQQFDRARKHFIEGLAQVTLEPRPGGYLVQAGQGRALLCQLRLTLTALSEQCGQDERVKRHHQYDDLGAADTLCDRHVCIAQVANTERYRADG